MIDRAAGSRLCDGRHATTVRRRLWAALVVGTMAAASPAAPRSERPAELHPIVDGSAQLFGASGGGQWYGDEATAKWFQPGQRFTFYSATRRLDDEVGVKLEND